MPISRKQKQIMAFPFTDYDALICDGAVRSGKTVFMMLAFVDDAMRRFKNQRFGICGKTIDSSVKNIVAPYLGLTYARKKYTIQWKRSDKLLIVKTKDRENVFEIFGGKDESSFMLIQGRTLAGVLFDEVALQPRSFVEQALARCSVEGSKFWFNCNPDSPQHWFYKEWIKQLKKHNAIRLHFQLEDNPSLSERIINRYKSMYSGVFYRRYINGEWCVAKGVVYDMFSTEKHVVKKHGNDGMYYVTCDYGTINPTVFLMWRLHDGRAALEREYYYNSRKTQRQKTDEEYYDDLREFIGDTPIERIITDPSAASFKACIRRHAEFPVMDADNEVIDGIRITGTLLNQDRITVHESCVNTIEEFGLYSWDEKSSVDKVVKENDHAMDATRYLFKTLWNKYFKHYD